MKKFKKGDKVICIDNKLSYSRTPLVLGFIYEVHSRNRVVTGEVYLKGQLNVGSWKESRFVPFPLSWAEYLCGKDWEIDEKYPMLVGIKISAWMVESKEMRFEDLYLKLKNNEGLG